MIEKDSVPKRRDRETPVYPDRISREIIVTKRPQRIPTHPGEMLRETALPELGLSVAAAARHLNVSRVALSNVLHEQADLSVDMAARMEKAFGLNMSHLLRMQLAHTEAIKRENWDDIDVERFGTDSSVRVRRVVTVYESKLKNLTCYEIEDIEGIGPVYRKKLSKAGITNTKRLLDRCSTAKGRRELAGETGLDDSQLLKWTNLADLMRISGIGKQFSELLEAAGVDTVKELRNRRADNLAAKMKEVNAVKKLARTTPSEKRVTSWVDQAKKLPPLITH